MKFLQDTENLKEGGGEGTGGSEWLPQERVKYDRGSGQSRANDFLPAAVLNFFLRLNNRWNHCPKFKNKKKKINNPQTIESNDRYIKEKGL